MSPALMNLLYGIALAGGSAWVVKWASSQSSKIKKLEDHHRDEIADLKIKHTADMSSLSANADQQIAVLREKVTSLQEEIGRVRDEVREQRALNGPAVARSRVLEDYAVALRHDASERGYVPLPWPSELRERA
jgi:hypothetical protein